MILLGTSTGQHVVHGTENEYKLAWTPAIFVLQLSLTHCAVSDPNCSWVLQVRAGGNMCEWLGHHRRKKSTVSAVDVSYGVPVPRSVFPKGGSRSEGYHKPELICSTTSSMASLRV